MLAASGSMAEKPAKSVKVEREQRLVASATRR
jgi:hypothetical protein